MSIDQTGSFYARLSDGRTAASHDANVRLDLSGLAITADGGEAMRWPYGSLQAAEPLRAHAVDVLLTSPSSPGVSLFVPSHDFATQLAPRAPHLTHHAARWRHARPWLIGAAVALGAIVLINWAGWSPTRTIAHLLPDSWRERLGDAALGSMVENRKRCTSPQGLAALDKLTGRLATAAGTGQTFKIVVVDWDLFNAFAVPGDKIIMTKGLIEKADSADEIAGVLAHEMGHGIEMHPETGIIRAVGLAAALELMMGGSSGTLANMGLMLAQLGYTRAAEREADEQALNVLRKAQISQQGLGAFFRRVLKEEGLEDTTESAKDKKDAPQRSDTSGRIKRALDMFSTHPPTAERAEMIRMSPSYASQPAMESGDWAAFRAICSVTAPLVEEETASK